MCVFAAWLRNGPEFIRAILLVALITLGTASAASARHRHGEPDRHRYPVRGIDVSHYQGVIDWRGVASDKVSFAYVKATEGVDGRDPQFARNWRGARRAGLRVGAYHFFSLCRSARAQARNFLAVTPRSAGALPPAVDLEPARGCHARGSEVRRKVTTYLAIVEARQRKQAVLYVTPQFLAAYGRDLPKRQMWRRSIRAAPASRGPSGNTAAEGMSPASAPRSISTSSGQGDARARFSRPPVDLTRRA